MKELKIRVPLDGRRLREKRRAFEALLREEGSPDVSAGLAHIVHGLELMILCGKRTPKAKRPLVLP